MTRRQEATIAPTGTPARAEAAGAVGPLPYRDAPTGAVVASEATLIALRKTRPWAMLFAVFLFAYAAAGGAAGVVWLVFLVARFVTGPRPTPPFIVWQSINLLFAPLALAGGLLAVAYFRAAGRAYWRRGSDDLERASIALNRLWRWAGVTIIILVAFPVLMFIAALLTHEFPG